MSCNYHLGSLVGRLNLAKSHNKSYIIEKRSNLALKVLKLLLKKHLIKSFIIGNSYFIIFLVYYPTNSAIKSFKINSTPSKRVFVSKYEIASMVSLNTCSFFLVSTVSGLLFGADCVVKNLGGELLLTVNL